jgi:eukaryotic-like serine/threonine-protein kinase
VSWFEAAAYAAWAGKALPVLGQWFQAADFDGAGYTVQLSNLTTGRLAAAGAYQGLGNYGTYDMAGNVREWIANPADGDLRFILGGSWKSPNYLYTNPEALSPFDRSDTNGFRCVRNMGAIPAAAAQPVHSLTRDFARYKPVSDEVFRAYKLLYAYPNTPLHAVDEGVVKETVDWREEKVTFDAAYNGERMAAYLFLPKRARPPYQTVLFFPSARVLFLPADSSNLGDLNFFDYIIQSGRAVMYPVYEDTYERRLKHGWPGQPDNPDQPVDWYKDAARSLDYLETRPDIDKDRMAYLGVSMGSGFGVIFTTLLQDRWRLLPRAADSGNGSGRLRAAHEEACADGERPLRLHCFLKDRPGPALPHARHARSGEAPRPPRNAARCNPRPAHAGEGSSVVARSLSRTSE